MIPRSFIFYLNHFLFNIIECWTFSVNYIINLSFSFILYIKVLIRVSICEYLRLFIGIKRTPSIVFFNMYAKFYFKSGPVNNFAFFSLHLKSELYWTGWVGPGRDCKIILYLQTLFCWFRVVNHTIAKNFAFFQAISYFNLLIPYDVTNTDKDLVCRFRVIAPKVHTKMCLTIWLKRCSWFRVRCFWGFRIWKG